MKKKLQKVIGVLSTMKDFNMKPNFSELERKYGIDRHTIKKYYENGGIPERKKFKKVSKWDPLYDLIISLSDVPGSYLMSIFQVLNYEYNGNLPGNYNSFKAYTYRRGIKCAPSNQTPHVYYETEPGEQLQCDWKENLKVHSVNGEVYEFNVFSATLGYSRKHVFIYSVGKTEDDFIRCVLETFRRLGGMTQILKTDNMTAIVSLRNGNRKIHSRVQSFFNDLGVKLELCECRTPETKGKCESSNRFVNWLVSFDYRIKNEQELIHIIENQITSECNKEINRRTKVPPAKLFLKEKEFLKPFGNNLNMDTYLREHRRVKVPSTLLVSYNGKQYSVPTKYIGKVVDIYAVGSEVYIYHNSQLITVHTVTECKLNYKHEHYIDALSRRLRTTQDDIEELAVKNLERLENLGGD